MSYITKCFFSVIIISIIVAITSLLVQKFFMYDINFHSKVNTIDKEVIEIENKLNSTMTIEISDKNKGTKFYDKNNVSVGYLEPNNPLDTLNYATWDMLPPDTQDQFADFFEGDMEKGKQLYIEYFGKFNPIHETAHAIRGHYQIESDLYTEEQSVNDIAVAYWREIGEEKFIENLRIKIEEVLSNLESPVPEGQDAKEYFNAEYHKLGRDPKLYGYFQFTFVLNSIEKNESFYQVLKNNVSLETKEKTKDLEIKYAGKNSNDVELFVNDFVKYVKLHNINSPEIKFNKKFRSNIQSIN